MEFTPGAYTKGDIVTVNGIQYVADRDILSAQALPKENMYWSVVGPVEAAPVPVSNTNQVPGLLTTNSPEQNTKAWENFIFSKPVGFAGLVYIPAGVYHFANELKIYERPIHLYGDNGTIWGGGTHLHFPKESMGIVILRGPTGRQETIIENLALFAPGNQNEWMDGIVIRGRVTLRGVYVKGFYNGIEGFGAMEDGSDISGSYIEKCFAAENTNDGFFLGRTDGNAITVIGSDARDNGRYGFNDDSFLGNYFISCMAHDNKKGHYYVRDKGNARSTFVACYGEMGSPVNELSPKTTVLGGFMANGYDKQDGKGVIYQ